VLLKVFTVKDKPSPARYSVPSISIFPLPKIFLLLIVFMLTPLTRVFCFVAAIESTSDLVYLSKSFICDSVMFI
jgi:hypothetical protein